ncbi:uncharacterized protein LOC107370324 [Tetranychus urticae]|uniref:MARVEL domain-containing protein n=1 Tax=Tetranychus urticae TaxID=32264 RepID=T1L4W3_TETUR|nr:uncharacterized protein LOC107370324 [Tetranychus urticae]
MNTFQSVLNHRYLKCSRPWIGCLFVAIYTILTSIFDLFWSIYRLLDEHHPFVFFLFFMLALESIVFLAVSCFMVLALIKNIRWLLLPWMIIAIVDITLAFALLFVQISLPNRDYGAPCVMAVFELAVTILVQGVLVYGLLLVFKYYVELDEKRVDTITKVAPHQDIVSIDRRDDSIEVMSLQKDDE